jgi:hypothetical protein
LAYEALNVMRIFRTACILTLCSAASAYLVAVVPFVLLSLPNIGTPQLLLAPFLVGLRLDFALNVHCTTVCTEWIVVASCWFIYLAAVLLCLLLTHRLASRRLLWYGVGLAFAILIYTPWFWVAWKVCIGNWAAAMMLG